MLKIRNNYLLFFSAVDDVFVRKDLLKTKYNFVNFAGAEENKHWCSHYSQCNYSYEKCIATGFNTILADISV